MRTKKEIVYDILPKMKTAAEILESHIAGQYEIFSHDQEKCVIDAINQGRREAIAFAGLIAFQYTTNNEDTKKLTTELLELIQTIK